jgi:hypothetical protein
MFTLLGYQSASVAAGTDTDLAAILDPTFTTRNNHFYFLEDYHLLAAWAGGPGVVRARLHCPTWDIFCPNEIFPTFPSAFTIWGGDIDLRTDIPLAIPKEQEFRAAVDVSGGAGGSFDSAMIWLGTPDWSRTLPRSEYVFRTRFSYNAPGGATTGWTGPFELTPAQILRGGVYSVIGAYIDTIGQSWFRLLFPQMPLYRGRELRPGDKSYPSTDGQPSMHQPWQGRYWGEWGRFHTFQLPKVEILNNAPSGAPVDVVLTLAYLGVDISLLRAGLQTI